MKTALLCLLLTGLAASCFAEGAAKQTTKTTKRALDVEDEIGAFYTRLTTSDADVQKQVKALTATVREDYGDHYRQFAVQVVQWFPYDLEWGGNKDNKDNKDYSVETGRYLVIQNVGFGRSRLVEYNMALVAEFEATVEITTAKIDPKHANRPAKVFSTHLTLRFLGFRDVNLTAAPLAP